MIRRLYKTGRAAFFSVFLLITAGCATYYEQNIEFQKQFVSGNIDKASQTLDKTAPKPNDRNRLLYLLQKGVVTQMQGEYEESNRWMEDAYIYTEDMRKTYAQQALSLLTNPMMVPYLGEDFEVVHINYYKALNYLRLGQYDEALVECRRINLKLNQLNDKYTNRKNRYRRDAFALNVMGIIFEAAGELNDAFIAYRNAYEAYTQDYLKSFGVGPPLQLKKDLLRTAALNGFTEELGEYQRDFGMVYEPGEQKGGELVFFWKNGLGPVKEEWSINFVIVKGEGGLVSFVNEDMGMNFTFPPIGRSNKDTDLGDLKVVRVAFPKYRARTPLYSRASLFANGEQFRLEEAQDINAIAFSCLEDRMMREFATSLLRFAVKQAAEEALKTKNEGLGAILSIINAATEKADTRNWQTLPYSISYVRVPLPAGENHFELTSYSSDGSRERTIEFDMTIPEGRTVFNMYHTLDTVDAFPVTELR